MRTAVNAGAKPTISGLTASPGPGRVVTGLTVFTDALHAEWTKLRTVAGTAWLLATTVVLTVGLSAASAAGVTCDSSDCGQDPAKVGLLGVTLGQAVVAVLAVLAVGEEYGTGMIRVTFAAVPHRLTVLAAKATAVAALTATAGALAILGSALTALALEPGNGFTPVHGYAELTTPATIRAALGSVLYLVLIALLSVGITTLLRDSALAVGTVLALLYLFPIAALVITDPDWHRHTEQIAPMQAGLTIQATTDLTHQPLTPWQGLAVLATWALAALTLGGTALRLRDA